MQATALLELLSIFGQDSGNAKLQTLKRPTSLIAELQPLVQPVIPGLGLE